MHTSEQPVLRDLVLVGGGHSHVGVLGMLAMHPEPGVRVTVICTDIDTPYSGMLPGYIAGHYPFEAVHIDLARLCVHAGARFYHSKVTYIDRDSQQVICDNRPPVPYDLLSINIGSTPQLDQVTGAKALAAPVKPIASFNRRWLSLLETVTQWATQRGRMTIAVVGGGAGGVELLLAMQHRLQKEVTAAGRNPADLQFVLLTAGRTILPTHNAHVQAQFMRVLRQRNVTVHLNTEVVALSHGCLHTKDGRTYDADETMWVTQAGGPAWLKNTGLSLDSNGFIQVNDCLQTLSDPAIFAAGDIAAFTPQPLEKAGVFAVRMAKPLTENLRRAFQGRALKPYRPQRTWLALISTGDTYAVASRGRWHFSGAWVWRWKDAIDRRFMRRFTNLPSMAPTTGGDGWAKLLHWLRPVSATRTHVALNAEESLEAIAAQAMRCGGCGAKVGANVLSRALSHLRPHPNDDVLIGLQSPDDAAVVRIPQGKAMVHSVDFFRAFIDDPYVFGKVAANHALGDIFAMGATPHTATAIATVPPGLEKKVEALLSEMMGGALEVLNAAGCTLVGGHTGEGKELALGFAMNGLVDADMANVMRKGGMQVGDAIVLTKAIGTGTLFAAHAQLAAKGVWVDAALQSMQRSNQAGAAVLHAHGATSCTDVTGFGLLGHLVEMTKAADRGAQIQLQAIPLLSGAVACVEAGIFSSLQSANVRLRRALQNADAFVSDARYPLLVDPQTAGGLLASIPADQADDCIHALHAAGYDDSAIIGYVTEALGADNVYVTLTL